MILDHVAIWTDKLETLKDYYMNYFGGIPNKKYTNEKKQFNSYFLTFKSGTRLEIMTMPDIKNNTSDLSTAIYKGITHLAFGVDTKEEVDKKAKQLLGDGYKIINGPRITGDGYYEFETLDPDFNRLEVATKI